MMVTLKHEPEVESPKILHRKSWKTDEDQRLKRIVGNALKRDWESISKQFLNRSPNACRHRWYSFLATKNDNGESESSGSESFYSDTESSFCSNSYSEQEPSEHELIVSNNK